jgi:hypothetical protein
LRGFGGFQKFFDKVQRSPYRLKNSAKIEKKQTKGAESGLYYGKLFKLELAKILSPF